MKKSHSRGQWHFSLLTQSVAPNYVATESDKPQHSKLICRKMIQIKNNPKFLSTFLLLSVSDPFFLFRTGKTVQKDSCKNRCKKESPTVMNGQESSMNNCVTCSLMPVYLFIALIEFEHLWNALVLTSFDHISVEWARHSKSLNTSSNWTIEVCV